MIAFLVCCDILTVYTIQGNNMKPKQFDTNIIFRTLTTTRDKFKEWCKNNNTTISKEFNNYMIDKLNTNTSNTTNTLYKHYAVKCWLVKVIDCF